MNLEELKDIWQAHSHQLAEEERHSAAAIRPMLYRRSRTALGRINRNLMLEAAFMGLTLLLSLLMLWQGEGFQGIFTVLALISVGSLVFYRIKYQQLNRATLGLDHLKTSLGEVARVMGHYMQLYFFMTLLMPLVGAISVLYGYSVSAAEDGRSLADLDATEWAILLGIAVVYGAIAYPATRWYVHRVYGIHHRELTACLSELQEHAEPTTD